MSWTFSSWPPVTLLPGPEQRDPGPFRQRRNAEIDAMEEYLSMDVSSLSLCEDTLGLNETLPVESASADFFWKFSRN